MPTVSINAALLSDANPYAPGGDAPNQLGADWLVLNGDFKVVSGVLKSVSNGVQASAIASSTPDTGYLETILQLNQISTEYDDPTGALFCTAAWTGYRVLHVGPEIYVASITGGGSPSTVAYHGSALFLTPGELFRYRYTIATDTIDIYQVSASDTVPLFSTTGLTYQAGFTAGFFAERGANGGGVITVSSTSADPVPTVVSISSPVEVGGAGYSGVTANMDEIVSITGGTITGTSENNFEFDALPFEDNIVYLELGDQLLTVIDSLDQEAEAEVSIDLMPGWSEIEIASLSADPDSLAETTTNTTLSVGDILYSNPDQIIVYDDTTISGAISGAITIWQRIAATNVMRSIQVINGAVVESGAFVVTPEAQALGCVTMTAVTLTARG